MATKLYCDRCDEVITQEPAGVFEDSIKGDNGDRFRITITAGLEKDKDNHICQNCLWELVELAQRGEEAE